MSAWRSCVIAAFVDTSIASVVGFAALKTVKSDPRKPFVFAAWFRWLTTPQGVSGIPAAEDAGGEEAANDAPAVKPPARRSPGRASRTFAYLGLTVSATGLPKRNAYTNNPAPG